MGNRAFVIRSITPYEIRICVLMFLLMVPDVFVGLSVLNTQYTPSFHCDVTLKNGSKTIPWSSLESEIRSKLANSNTPIGQEGIVKQFENSCEKYNSTLDVESIFNASQNELSTLRNTTPTVPCENLIFQTGYITAVTEFELVCKSAWKEAFVTSLFMFGGLIGSVFGGTCSDRFGRRTVVLVSVFVEYFSAFVLSFTATYTSYCIVMFAFGIGNSIVYASSAVLASELVHPNHRSFVYSANVLGYSVGYMLLGLACYILTDWRWYLRFASFVGALYIPYYWILDESPLWLYANNRKNQAEKLLKKMARINKSKNCHISMIEHEKEVTSWATWVEFCKQPLLIVRLFIILMGWMVTALGYYAITLNSNNLAGNRFLNIFFGGLMELLAMIIFYGTVQFWGRKNSYVLLTFIAAVALVAIPYLKLWNETSVVVVTMLAKLAVTVTYSILYVYTGELFPTNIRHGVFGISVAMARIGSILAPYVIYSDVHGNSIVTSLVMGGLVFVSALLVFLLPKTKNIVLPGTVKEALKLNGRLCCIENKSQSSPLEISKEESLSLHNTVI